MATDAEIDAAYFANLDKEIDDAYDAAQEPSWKDTMRASLAEVVPTIGRLVGQGTRFAEENLPFMEDKDRGEKMIRDANLFSDRINAQVPPSDPLSAKGIVRAGVTGAVPLVGMGIAAPYALPAYFAGDPYLSMYSRLRDEGFGRAGAAAGAIPSGAMGYTFGRYFPKGQSLFSDAFAKPTYMAGMSVPSYAVERSTLAALTDEKLPTFDEALHDTAVGVAHGAATGLAFGAAHSLSPRARRATRKAAEAEAFRKMMEAEIVPESQEVRLGLPAPDKLFAAGEQPGELQNARTQFLKELPRPEERLGLPLPEKQFTAGENPGELQELRARYPQALPEPAERLGLPLLRGEQLETGEPLVGGVINKKPRKTTRGTKEFRPEEPPVRRSYDPDGNLREITDPASPSRVIDEKAIQRTVAAEGQKSFPDIKQAAQKALESPKPPPMSAEPEYIGLDSGEYPVVRRRVQDIGANPELMQYKAMDDEAETGVNKAEKLQGKWDDIKAGVLLLWEPRDPADPRWKLKPGQKYVVADGHHRLEGAQARGVKSLNTIILRETDGYSAQDARTLAAETNIVQGRGTDYDAVKFLRNSAATYGKDAALERARQAGFTGRKAAAIAFNAADNLYDALINHRISPEQAEALARRFPSDELAHQAGLRFVLQNGEISPGRLADAVQELNLKQEHKNAFGEATQGDMFGKVSDAGWEDALRRSDIIQKWKKYWSDRRVLARRALADPEAAREMGIPFENKQLVKNKLDAAESEYSRWSNYKRYPDLVERLSRYEEPERAQAEPEGPQNLSLFADEKGSTPIFADAVNAVRKNAKDIADAVVDMFTSDAGFRSAAPSERFTQGKMRFQVLPKGVVRVFRDQFVFPKTLADKFPNAHPSWEARKEFWADGASTAYAEHKTLEPYWQLENRARLDRFLIEERKAALASRKRGFLLPEFTPEKLAAAGLSPEEIAAHQAVRKWSDRALDYIEEGLLIDGRKIKDPEVKQQFENDVRSYIREMRTLHYVPASRLESGWDVKAYDGGDYVVYRNFFKSKRAARKAMELQKRAGRRVTGEEMVGQSLDAYDEIPDLSVQLRQFDAEKWEKRAKKLPVTGFSKHLIHASMVEGYETDLSLSLSDYTLGLSRFIARKRLQPRKEAALAVVDPKRENGLRAKLIADFDSLERPKSKFERSALNVVNTMALAGVPISGLVNSTQMLTTTAPEVYRYIGAKDGAKVWNKAAKDTLKYMFQPEAFRKANPWPYQALEEGLQRGDLEAQSLTELNRFRRGDKRKRGTNEVLMLTFSIPEKTNRVHAFLCALDIAGRQGKQGSAALKFAEEFVDETQFNYSEANRPKIMRHPVGRLALQYKNFLGNMLRYLRNRMTAEDWKTAAISLSMTGALGGGLALPFAKELKYLTEGLGYDPAATIREKVGNRTAAELGMYGLPSLANANITNSIGPSELVQGIDRNPYEAAVKTVSGPIGDLLAVRPFKALAIAKQGEPWIAAETMMPRFLRGPSKVARSLYEGVKTGTPALKDYTGRTILEDPTAWEYAQILAGATPQRGVREYERRHSQHLLKNRIAQAREGINLRLAKAIAGNDREGIEELRQEIIEHNRTARPEEQITLHSPTIKRLVAERRNPRLADYRSIPRQGRKALQRLENLYQ